MTTERSAQLAQQCLRDAAVRFLPCWHSNITFALQAGRLETLTRSITRLTESYVKLHRTWESH